jgi:hypothetical protein
MSRTRGSPTRSAARQYPGRCRDAGRADRGGAELGLYRPPRRLAGRSDRTGRSGRAAIEEKLSDALHTSLTQRFVDKRTTVLLRQIGSDPDAMPVTIAEDGEVRVDDEPIGRLDGFRFSVAADARMAAAAADPATPPPLRALLVPLTEAGGVMPRASLDVALTALDKPGRHGARRLGLAIGALDLFHPQLLKPEAMRWRMALAAIRANDVMPSPPPPGAAVLAGTAPNTDFRTLGSQALRIDLVERIARAAHDARDGRRPFVPDPALAVSMGLGADALGRLMRLLGFEAHEQPQGLAWRYRGRVKPRTAPTVRPGNAFADLGALVVHGR